MCRARCVIKASERAQTRSRATGVDFKLPRSHVFGLLIRGANPPCITAGRARCCADAARVMELNFHQAARPANVCDD